MAAGINAKMPMTSVMWVRNLIDSLCACGLDGFRLAKQAGISQETLDAIDSGVWAKEIIRLWELAVESSGNPDVGLLAAQSFRPSSMGVLGYSMMASPTLFEALQRCIRYSGSMTTATTASLARINGEWSFAFHIMTGVIVVQRQNHEYLVSSILQFLRHIAGQDLKPIRAEFLHAAPNKLTIYQDFFSCPLVFESNNTALIFSERDLARQLLTSNPLLVSILDAAAEQRIIEMGKAETTQRVRQLIVQSLSNGEPTRDDIAAQMNMSPRSLQRRLQEENQSFHEILDAVRHSMAESYLSKDNVCLSSIADMLGFSDQSSFTRAAHRWFNLSPKNYRAMILERRKLR